jgi:Protein of unknown function (DUF1329)
MNAIRNLIAALAVVATFVSGAAIAAEPETMSQPIPEGTVITPQNWQQYKSYMTDGMQALFAGTYTMKFPPDFQMVVDKTHSYQPPPSFIQATEKYSPQVKIVDLPGGKHTITNYVAGLPFPNPKPPLQGWKLLMDTWYAYVPWMLCTPDGRFVFEDRLGNISGDQWFLVNRIFSHRSDAGVTPTDPKGEGMYNTQFFQILKPEQARYTSLLSVYYDDLTKTEDTFLFIPALRRTLRLSSAARCSPALGSDFAIDDTRHSTFNGNPTRFDANYVGDRGVLEMIKPDPYLSSLESSFYMPIFYPKPMVGKWEVRDSFVLDVMRVPSESKGYCYGKKRLYIDKQMFDSIWGDIYDENLKLWKVDYDPGGIVDVPGEGPIWSNNGWGVMIDVQNSHLTHVDFGHHGFYVNQDCANAAGNNYTDIGRYSSVRGLSQIMQ